jgi:DegV family protein with EDD domain
MLKLFGDTDMDLTPSLAKEFGYTTLISMPYIENEKEIFPYESWDSFDPHKFYESLRQGNLPKTSGISPEKYREYFEPEFKKGNDILYVHFSSAMSGTFNAMRLALEMLKEDYPNRKFYEIDTKAITIDALNIALAVGDLYKKGASIQEILDWAKVEVDHYAVYFYADDLKFFRRSGRVSGLTATMGNLFGVRPIIFMDDKGIMRNIGKESGHLNAMRRLITYVKTLGDHPEDHRIIIAHTDALHIAKKLESLLHEAYPNKNLDIMIVPVNPTAGAHCGPDAAGISFHSIHR